MTQVGLRPAVAGDGTFLWRLRNDPEVRRQSRNDRPVEWDEHVQWLNERLRDFESTRLYVAELDGEPCGQIRVDRHGGALGEISIALVSGARSRGVGSQLIALGSERGASDLGLTALVAVIKQTNGASMRAFSRAGYCEDGPAADLADAVQMRLTVSSPN